MRISQVLLVETLTIFIELVNEDDGLLTERNDY